LARIALIVGIVLPGYVALRSPLVRPSHPKDLGGKTKSSESEPQQLGAKRSESTIATKPPDQEHRETVGAGPVRAASHASQDPTTEVVADPATRQHWRLEELGQAQSEKVARKEAYDIYRLAKMEFVAARQLKDARQQAKDSDKERFFKGNAHEADRLAKESRQGYERIRKSFPGTQAAADAQKLLDGKELAERPLPPNPDDIRNNPADRLADLEKCLKVAARQAWAIGLKQVPATVIDQGLLRHVPYFSFRAGDYEVNVYGDPRHPACLEIGLHESQLGSQPAKVRCVEFLAAALDDSGDRALLNTLNVAKDVKRRAGLTFEVTPETAPDAYGGWWISVYDVPALDRSRASEKELQTIAVRRQAVGKTSESEVGTGWTAQDLAFARPARENTSGSDRIYVRRYHRRDGTYVPAQTTSAALAGR
jgi:hypothetical protein